jgi:hypothetical protein
MKLENNFELRIYLFIIFTTLYLFYNLFILIDIKERKLLD